LELEGKNLKLAPLTIEDAYDMRSWGQHESKLLADYNFPYINDTEVKTWFRFKTFNWRNSYFSVRDKDGRLVGYMGSYFSVRDKDGRLVGYMGIKNKRPFKRTAFLGIVFDPDNINKGLGTEALETFLPYYFEKLRMKALLLEVAEFNERAIHVYEKLGFKKTAYYLDPFPDQGIDRSDPELIRWESCFVFDGEKIYNYIYQMKLTKDVYLSRKRS